MKAEGALAFVRVLGGRAAASRDGSRSGDSVKMRPGKGRRYPFNNSKTINEEKSAPSNFPNRFLTVYFPRHSGYQMHYEN